MSKLRLTDREWDIFTIADICNIKSGVRLTKSEMQNGKLPFIGATDSNNGITGFISNNNESLDKNVLGVNYNGSVVKNFYHSYQCLFSDDVKRLKIKHISGNKYQYLFLKMIILQQESKYKYGYKFNAHRMAKQKVLLPINEAGSPDWQFMEDFMRQKEQAEIAKIKKYYTNKAAELMIELGNIGDKEWREFFIGGENGIFEIKATKSGIDKNKLNHEMGKTPYITRSDIDNGMNLFITDNQHSKYQKDKGNVITIGLDTQTVFYQKNDFFTGQNIQILSNKNLNYYVAMFVIPLLKIQIRKFSWGSTGATLSRLNRTKILLPIDSSGSPD